jgi:hypothetical protein
MNELVKTTIALMRAGWPGESDAQLAFRALAETGHVIFAGAWRHPVLPSVPLDATLEAAVAASLKSAARKTIGAVTPR